MIFYFSGTGNSLHAAKRLGELLKDEKLVSIADYTKKRTSSVSVSKDASVTLNAKTSSAAPDATENSGLLAAAETKGLPKPYTFDLEMDERVGFVFPIYAWGPPQQVIDFIDNLALKNNLGNYIYAVATCGKNIGNTMKSLKKHLMRKMLRLDSGFSLVMPNNYIMAGDVNSKDEEKEILARAEEFFRAIAGRIENRERSVFIIEKGPVPFLLTGVIHPAFTHQPFKTKAFYATDACNQCGICVNVCNCANIKLGTRTAIEKNASNERGADTTKKPVWGDDCTQCLACLHYCPTRAVQYGKATLSKGRYTNPNVKWNYL